MLPFVSPDCFARGGSQHKNDDKYGNHGLPHELFEVVDAHDPSNGSRFVLNATSNPVVSVRSDNVIDYLRSERMISHDKWIHLNGIEQRVLSAQPNDFKMRDLYADLARVACHRMAFLRI